MENKTFDKILGIIFIALFAIAIIMFIGVVVGMFLFPHIVITPHPNPHPGSNDVEEWWIVGRLFGWW